MNQAKITPAQLTCINIMLNKLKIDKDIKEAMVLGFSNNRSTSSRDLYLLEAKAMIRHLKELDPEEKAAEVMRRKIISRAHEMGWKKPDGAIDMKRLDDWCIKYSYLKKKINQYQYKELPMLVTIFEEKVYKQFLNAL